MEKIMPPFGFDEDNWFIQIIRDSMKKAKTKWGLFILSIYILAFIFSMVALSITVVILSNFPQAHETVKYTKKIFNEFGYPLGFAIMTFHHLVDTFIIPFLCMIIVLLSEETSFYRFVNMTCFSFIEAYAFFHFSSHFLDMFNDIVVLNLLINRELIFHLLSEEIILAISLPILLTVFCISFFARFFRHVMDK